MQKSVAFIPWQKHLHNNFQCREPTPNVYSAKSFASKVGVDFLLILVYSPTQYNLMKKHNPRLYIHIYSKWLCLGELSFIGMYMP